MKKILLITGAGYAFKQLLYQIINKIGTKFHLHIIVNNNNLKKYTIDSVNKLISSGKIKSYEIAEVERPRGIIKNIIHYKKFDSLIKKKFDYLIISQDRSAFARFLITQFRKQGGKVILISSRTLGANYYKRWYSADGKFINATTKNIKREAASYFSRIRLTINEMGWFKFLVYVYKLIFNKKYFIFLFEYKILPFFLTGSPLPSNNIVSKNITGFADYTIVFDQVEYDNFKTLLPSINNLILAKHPMVGYCKNNKKMNNSNLLVLLPLIAMREYMHEKNVEGFKNPEFITADSMSDDKMQKWISTIKAIKELKNPSQIHLRFHPKENKIFFMQFEKELSLNNIQYTTLNSTEVSIVDTVCDYMGVIGAPSQSLKIFRWATKGTFVLCLEKAGAELSEKFYYMGDTEGITRITENTVIDIDMLTPPKNLPFDNYPTVENYLNNI